MNSKDFVITKLQGYSGIRLRNGSPLVFKPGINLLVGRNGSGKSNLINLIHAITTNQGDLRTRIESSFFVKSLKGRAIKKNSSIEKSFGQKTIAEYSLRGQAGKVRLLLKSTPAEYVVDNLLQPAENFQGNIAITIQKIPLKFNWINSNQSSIKFEMSGYISTNVLSREHENKAHKIMEGPIKSVSDFVRANINEFYRSKAFVSKMSELENSINLRFTKFFGNTKKRAKINYHDIDRSGRISLSLMDGDNYIESSYISTGETVLLNLIFSLTAAKEDRCDILCMDEPDVHMHDDMIQVLVDELSELSKLVPEMIIVIASHSSAMIERVAALNNDKVNVITFDQNRNVSNDSSDIDLINALNNNGVKFSPLMLSRKTNIFIENQLGIGKNHRDFLLKFFPEDNKPNIIPIGNSGNVHDKKSFVDIFEEILNVSNVRSVGIQDGDIWFKSYLTQYLTDEISIGTLTNLLLKNNLLYIPTSHYNSLFYFNFWEIENLYLLPELLHCWIGSDGTSLDMNFYNKFLNQKRKLIADEYLKTYFKHVTRIKIDRKYTLSGVRRFVEKRITYIQNALSDGKNIDSKVNLLIDSFLENSLTGWFPGKEIKNGLERAGFRFHTTNFDFEASFTSQRLREIQNFNN